MVVMVAYTYECIKNHWTVHFKFTCELNFNKVVFLKKIQSNRIALKLHIPIKLLLFLAKRYKTPFVSTSLLFLYLKLFLSTFLNQGLCSKLSVFIWKCLHLLSLR